MSKFQVPRGTQDIFGKQMEQWSYLEDLIEAICKVYNYQKIKTPMFEHTEVFNRDNDSSDMVNKEMYTFSDAGGRSLTLRPEGTAGVIRSFVEHKMFGNPDLPVKLYYVEPNFRYERPQKGRMRQHHQFGVEVIGIKSHLIDVEVIDLGYSFLKLLGLKELKVIINTLGDSVSRTNYQKALSEYFKNPVKELCSDCQRRYLQNPLRILDCKIDKNNDIVKNAPKLNDYLSAESKVYFDKVLKTLELLEIPYQVDYSLVRGLDYYGDTVFEVVSCNENMGSQATIFAGGRYDKFVEYYGGPELSGMGFGMGVERLLVALESEGIDIGNSADVDVYIMPLEDQVLDYSLELATLLRAHGYSADLSYQSKKFKSLFNSADRKKAKVVFIIGTDELNNQQVTMKHLALQQQVTITTDQAINQLDKWFKGEDHEH
ncbi:MAG: histidine--tRNA ligase [Erysipelotrichaceae bacterium]